jgi:hypothetical protein
MHSTRKLPWRNDTDSILWWNIETMISFTKKFCPASWPFPSLKSQDAPQCPVYISISSTATPSFHFKHKRSSDNAHELKRNWPKSFSRQPQEYSFLFGSTAQIGPMPLHRWDFEITQTHTTLDRNRPVAEAISRNTYSSLTIFNNPKFRGRTFLQIQQNFLSFLSSY